MKSICVVTTTRAEYGLLRNVIRHIDQHPELELCLIVTGTHLLAEYGETYEEIEQDGFPIAQKVAVEMTTDTPSGISQTMGRFFTAFSDVFEQHSPDFLIVLGDRYELIPICFCALNVGIPIAHISGGETTEGAIDEVVRHCVTKMSYLHFPGCEEYRRRIIQLGEDPCRVYNYGDVGVENAMRLPLLSKEQLQESLQFSLDGPYFSVTFHPVTMESRSSSTQIRELLQAITQLPQYRFIITKANADAGGIEINRILDEFAPNAPNCKVVASLGVVRYLSSLKYAQGIIGNSSSGIVEAPCFGIPTINIGDRQKGRLQASSVLNCLPEAEKIRETILLSQTPEFLEQARNTVNPYGNGETAKQIVDTIWEVLSKGTINLKKSFYNLSFNI